MPEIDVAVVGWQIPQPAIASKVRVSRIASAILPTVGGTIFAVALLNVLVISGGTRALFLDSDAGWHIRTGEAILRNMAVPRSDPFSFSVPGKQWFAWEWLSDILLGAAHRLAGPAGVALLAAVVIAVTAWGVARLALALGGNLLFTAGAVGLFGVTSIHWLARPHIFSWFIALVFLAVTERHRRHSGFGTRDSGPICDPRFPLPGSRFQAWYLLPILSCLWANVHGSFPLGPGILFVYAAGEWLNQLHDLSAATVRERVLQAATASERLRVLRLLRWPSSATNFAALGLASLAATAINPYGWKLHAHVASFMRDSYMMDHISEYSTFSFHTPGAVRVELFLVIAVLGTLAMARQRSYGPALLAVVLLHLSLYSVRYIPVAAVLLLPLSVAALTREAETVSMMSALARYSERVRGIDREMWGAIPVAIVLALAAGFVLSRARAGDVGFESSKFPVQAAEYFEKRGLDGRIYAHDQWGGYLIYRFDGRLKVFVDGRADYYGRDMAETTLKISEAKPGWDAALESFDIQFALVPRDAPLASVLALKPEWKQVYADSTAAIFERAG